MNRVFADAQYWVAMLYEKDQDHAAARAVTQSMQRITIFTTEEALTEVLAFFSERGLYLRQVAVRLIDKILTDPAIVVLHQSHQTFQNAFDMYKSRPDKGYSLTDCVSMLSMRQEGISAILTHDAHFTQEGFTVLL